MASRRSRSNDSCGGLVVAAVVLAVLWGWLSSSIEGNAWLGVLVLVGIAAAIVWLVRRLSGPKTQTAGELAGRFKLVRVMSGPQPAMRRTRGRGLRASSPRSPPGIVHQVEGCTYYANG